MKKIIKTIPKRLRYREHFNLHRNIVEFLRDRVTAVPDLERTWTRYSASFDREEAMYRSKLLKDPLTGFQILGVIPQNRTMQTTRMRTDRAFTNLSNVVSILYELARDKKPELYRLLGDLICTLNSFIDRQEDAVRQKKKQHDKFPANRRSDQEFR